MARSDLLINLVKAGASGDQPLFRKTADALIVEERGKNHGVLADRLAQAATLALVTAFRALPGKGEPSRPHPLPGAEPLPTPRSEDAQSPALV